MVKTLRESKAKLSELVQQASQGEEIIITVRGKPRAKLVAVGPADPEAGRAAWIEELREIQKANETGAQGPTVEAILDELREDRF